MVKQMRKVANSRRQRFLPQIYERIITKDGVPYSIVQIPPRKEFEVWLHEDNDPGKEPNRQSYFTGKLQDEVKPLTIYVEGGKVHRLDGPAVIINGWFGTSLSYYINGLKFTKREFWEHVKDTEYGDRLFAETFGITDDD